MRRHQLHSGLEAPCLQSQSGDKIRASGGRGGEQRKVRRVPYGGGLSVRQPKVHPRGGFSRIRRLSHRSKNRGRVTVFSNAKSNRLDRDFAMLLQATAPLRCCSMLAVLRAPCLSSAVGCDMKLQSVLLGWSNPDQVLCVSAGNRLHLPGAALSAHRKYQWQELKYQLLRSHTAW
jgi:hypothetical protein